MVRTISPGPVPRPTWRHAFDWSRTPLGPIDAWPRSLNVAVSACLASRFPMYIWWGRDLVNIYNDAYAPILGKRHPAALGQAAPALWAEIWPTLGPQAEAVTARGESTWHERVPLPVERNGFIEDAYFTWSQSPLPDDRGGIGGLLCVVVEDTPRVMAERERDRLAAHRQLALDAARLGWWHYDPATQVASFDRRYTEIFGVSGHQKPNEEILKRLHPDDLPLVWAKVEAALNPADPKPYSAEYRVIRPDGSVRWVEAHGSATFEGDGLDRRATSFVGTVADVTDRKREADQSRTILESITDAFFAVDREWRFTYLNPRAARVLGKSADELLGRAIWDVYPGLRGSEFERVYLRVAAEQVAGSFTAFYPDHDRWYEVHAYPAPDGISVYFRDVTEAKRVEEAARAGEVRFRELADAMPQIVWVARADGSYEYFNERWYEFTGRPTAPAAPPSAAGADGGWWADVLHPDDRDRARAEWDRSVRAGSPFEIEYRLRHRDGGYRWTLGRALPVRNDRGGVERWFGTGTDVHDLKSAEEALRHSRGQLELVVRGANVGVWYCPLPFDALVWDETVKAHFHLPPDAAVTIDTFYERMHPDDRERTRLAIADSIDRQRPYDVEYRTVSPDGRATKWVRASGRGFYDAAGSPVRFDGITIDITERVRAEERVREESRTVETINRIGRSVAAELDLERLVQAVTDATTGLTGAQFGAFFYNVLNDRGESYALYALSGVPRERFARFPMPRNTDVFGPTFRGEGVIRLDDVTADPRYARNAPNHGMPAGHLPVRSYLAVPVVSRSGEVLGGLFFGHADVGVFGVRHERVAAGIAAQAAVAIDNARLFDAARRANAATDQLLASEREARAEAERAGRMKDEFLSTLSHELRTPLNAIVGWAQILTAAPPDAADLRDGLDTILRNARAQTQIIEDLLDMSRIISGKVRLDVRRADLAAVVRAAIETVRPAAAARGVRIRAVLDPATGPVSGDPGRLQQVFWNLLSNAVKFTPRDGQIQVVLERVNSHVEVSVADTGEGIAPEFLPFVFDRFRQADSSTTRMHGGLGLGLAIVKQLVELHGGTVRVKSPGAGAGTTFQVALPLTVIHAEAADVAERRHPTAAAADAYDPEACPRIAGVRVLVVDDEPDARALVTRLLEDCDAVVRSAASAAEALALIAAERPDVLVSDIGMPGEDGYALIRKIRALPAADGGDTPAAALTAYARSEDRVRAIRAGYQTHLVKPVEPAELITIVASLARRTAQ